MWRYAFARATGSSHFRLSLPCQDRCSCMAEDGVLIAALADGAGSAKYAEAGAEIIVNEMIANLSTAAFEQETDFAAGLLRHLR